MCTIALCTCVHTRSLTRCAHVHAHTYAQQPHGPNPECAKVFLRVCTLAPHAHMHVLPSHPPFPFEPFLGGFGLVPSSRPPLLPLPPRRRARPPAHAGSGRCAQPWAWMAAHIAAPIAARIVARIAARIAAAPATGPCGQPGVGCTSSATGTAPVPVPYSPCPYSWCNRQCPLSMCCSLQPPG